jgi:hypothetical protein
MAGGRVCDNLALANLVVMSVLGFHILLLAPSNLLAITPKFEKITIYSFKLSGPFALLLLSTFLKWTKNELCNFNN